MMKKSRKVAGSKPMTVPRQFMGPAKPGKWMVRKKTKKASGQDTKILGPHGKDTCC